VKAVWLVLEACKPTCVGLLTGSKSLILILSFNMLWNYRNNGPTFYARVAGFQIALMVGIARIQLVQIWIWNFDVAFGASRAFSVEQWKNVFWAAEKHRVFTKLWHKVGMNIETATGFHSSPACWRHCDHLAVPATAGFHRLQLTDFLSGWAKST